MKATEMVKTLNVMVEVAKMSARAEVLLETMRADALAFKKMSEERQRDDRERLYWLGKYDLVKRYISRLED